MKFAIAMLTVLIVGAACMVHAGERTVQPKERHEFPRCFGDALSGNFYSAEFSFGVSGGGATSAAEWTRNSGALGGRVFGTYDHTPCIALEGAVGFYGNFWSDDSYPENRYLFSGQLGLVARFYIRERFLLFGRIGGHRWNLGHENPGPAETRHRIVFDKSDGIDPYYGGGAEIVLGEDKNWHIGISATQYRTSYEARIFRYNSAVNAYDPPVRENGSGTTIIEFSITRRWKAN